MKFCKKRIYGVYNQVIAWQSKNIGLCYIACAELRSNHWENYWEKINVLKNYRIDRYFSVESTSEENSILRFNLFIEFLKYHGITDSQLDSLYTYIEEQDKKLLLENSDIE